MTRLFVFLVLGTGPFLLTGQPSGPSGDFTPAQAEGGRVAYQDTCGKCHTPTLQGRTGAAGELPPVSSLPVAYQKFAQGFVPPLTGPVFMNRWGAKTAARLIARIQEAVPAFPPAGTNEETSTNLAAYFLQVSGAEAGTQPLTRTTAVTVNSITQKVKRLADGKQWMTRNLDVNVMPSYCYDDAEPNCQLYGRLYTWASAREVCAALGEGWRLPADGEWRQMAQKYGGVSQDAADKGQAAYHALLDQGSSGFHAVLGGGRGEDGKYWRLEAHGFYWTASESEPGKAFYYNFGKGGPGLHRQSDGEKARAFAVRCVRD